MTDRGERLAQDKRKKKKMTKVLKETWFSPTERKDSNLMTPKRIGKMSHTPHSCSCRMCGNPRKYEKGKAKLTMQEQRKLPTKE
jgi:hypothetical protein